MGGWGTDSRAPNGETFPNPARKKTCHGQTWDYDRRLVRTKIGTLYPALYIRIIQANVC